jgi:diguanylate cyclase (GGDEF)-like protein
MHVVSRTLAAALGLLPRGGDLPDAEFERRHRWLLSLLLASGAVLSLYGVVLGYPVPHALLDGLVPLLLGALGLSRSVGRRGRSIGVTLGLSTSAAVGVHLSGGLIEAHFSFFVIVLLLTLYEDWAIFGLAVGFVLVHHGAMGTIDPSAVYNLPSQYEHPWRWAAIHAVFVAAAGVGAVIAWRLNEDVRSRMRDVQTELARAASTDALTGLANRRALVADLDHAVAASSAEGAESVLVLADLDGFKPYNDMFGHLAGDALLQRLGRRLAEETSGLGTAYRLGGDEFCVLAAGGDKVALAVEAAVSSALREAGDGFTVSASCGVAQAPADAASAGNMLLMADQRMYAHKTGGRPSAQFQSRSVLLRALNESHPTLGHNLDDVADLAERVARQIGMGDEELEQVRHVAELHDVGKVAIPDAILDKPGALDAAEWEFMKRHTLIGERIVAAAPALANVARNVRSTHERWDGAGYPDGLAGTDIPLAARIVSVCDAFDAMVNARPYRAASNLEDAVAELRRCCGTQFDPGVVVAFEAVLADVSGDQQAA